MGDESCNNRWNVMERRTILLVFGYRDSSPFEWVPGNVGYLSEKKKENRKV